MSSVAGEGVQLSSLTGFDEGDSALNAYNYQGSEYDNNSVAIGSMNEEELRRHQRNLREQQRSHRISHQIKELRSILSESNVPFKPTKYSILSSVVEYVRHLQSHSLLLDEELKKLVNTISQTTDIINSGSTEHALDLVATSAQVTSSNTSQQATVIAQCTPTASISNTVASTIAETQLPDAALNYHSLFDQCCAALAVATLDGRFLDCNAEFELLSGYTKAELMQFTIFNLLANTDMEGVFRALGQMLVEAHQPQQLLPNQVSVAGSSLPSVSTLTSNNNVYLPPDPSSHYPLQSSTMPQQPQPSSSSNRIPPVLTYWCGDVTTARHGPDIRLQMNITLATNFDGSPKFFNCSLSLRS